jgi:hypothetical protein
MKLNYTSNKSAIRLRLQYCRVIIKQVTEKVCNARPTCLTNR